MKKLLMSLIVFATILTPQAEAGYRDIVLEKLDFFYIDNPGSVFPGYATTEINKLKIARGDTINSPLWTHADNDGLQALLEDLLREPSRGGDARLQRVVATVLAITSKKVRIFLYHDNANSAHHASMPIYMPGNGNYAAGHGNAAWPSGNTYRSDPTYTGLFGIGSYFNTAGLNAGGWTTEREKKVVFIHELVHTQLDLAVESTLTTNMYGPDGGHTFWEMIPSRNSAFDEGIANAFAFRYYLPPAFSVTSALNADRKLYAEDIASCASATAHCLQHRLAADSVASAGGCSAGTDCYKIRDIPADVILHNEMISANVLYQVCAQFRSTSLLARATRSAKADMANSSNYTFMPLFKELTRAANNYHNRSNPSGTRTHGQFMPVAILDYYTGYKIDSKATLETVLGTTWASTDTNIDDYFSSHRATLTGFRPNATTWHVGNQLSRLSQHLHVRTPQGTTASNK